MYRRALKIIIYFLSFSIGDLHSFSNDPPLTDSIIIKGNRRRYAHRARGTDFGGVVGWMAANRTANGEWHEGQGRINKRHNSRSTVTNGSIRNWNRSNRRDAI